MIYLNQIINQIIHIDSQAYENKNKNEEFLLKKKQEFEGKVADYRNEKLKSVSITAQTITEEAEAFVAEIEESEKEIVNRISTQIEENYKNAENRLIQEIFDRLFVSEG